MNGDKCPASIQIISGKYMAVHLIFKCSEHLALNWNVFLMNKQCVLSSPYLQFEFPDLSIESLTVRAGEGRLHKLS